MDEFTRQGIDIRLGRSIIAGDVIRILDELFQHHGRPVCLRSDNGPELVSHAVQDWSKDRHVGTHYIEPGSPWQNACNESFNSIFRTTCLDRWLFSSMTEARVVIQQWPEEYNTVRPEIIGWNEPGAVLTTMGGRKFESTTENPSSVTGPEIPGLTC